MAKNKSIQYGQGVGLTEEDVAPKNIKMRITMNVDGDVLDFFRQRAEAEGSKYQTLMNHALRQFMEGSSDEMQARLERLEKAVFHKSS